MLSEYLEEVPVRMTVRPLGRAPLVALYSGGENLLNVRKLSVLFLYFVSCF